MGNTLIKTKKLGISKDVTKYWKQIGYKLPEKEKVAVLWNETSFPIEEKLAILKRYVNSDSPKDTWVRDMLAKCVKKEETGIRTFQENSEKDFIFQLQEFEEGDLEYYDTSFTEDFHLARELGTKLDADFRILKKRIRKDSLTDGDETTSGEGQMCFSKDGTIESYYLSDDVTPTDEWYVDLIDRYVETPHPFKQLDLVQEIGDPEEKIGIVRWVALDSEKKQHNHARYLDYTDNVVTLEWFYEEDGTFGHDHVSPLRLKFARLDKNDFREEILRLAVNLLEGNEYLQTYDMFSKRYRR